MISLFMYSKPYSVKQIKRYYSKISRKLLNDPVHLWRAETGIELIHKEPSLDEQKRIWKNWLEMPKELKKASNKRSLELFSMNNREHNQKIMKKWTSGKTNGRVK